MTPNKLPPLPELIEKALKRAFNLGQAYWQQSDSQYTSDHKRSDVTLEKFKALSGETLEALRQSQSLPAGAVADDLEDLVHKLCDRAFGDGLDNRDTYSGHTQVLRRKLIEGIAALQADAREKGEALNLAPNPSDQLADYILDKLNGFSRYYRGLEHLRKDLRMAMRCATPQAAATHPAQASEAVSYQVAEDALDRFVAMAPSGDHWPPERLKALRVEALRTAMQNAMHAATSSQETASE